MALETCDCDTPLGNTGVLSCVTLPKATSMLIFVPLTDGDGNPNEINLLTDVLDQAYFDSRINDPDPLKRWYPAAGFKVVSDERADPVTEAIDNETIIVEEGQRLFSGSILKQGVIFAGKLQQNGCAEFGAFYVDGSGNLTGDGATPDRLRPVPINENTWDVRAIFNTKSTTAKVQISYEYGTLVKDKDLRTITNDQIDINILTLRGLVDVNTTVSAISLTSHTVTATHDYWAKKGPAPFEGLLAGDFKVVELSPTPGNIPITNLAEPSPGVYVFTYAATTNNDVLETVLDALKLGFDFAETEHTAAP